MNTIVNATVIALNNHGILIAGGSETGKSDVAYRMIQTMGATLVADGEISLMVQGETLIATPPAMTAGHMHIHGVGTVKMPFEHSAPVRCCVHLSPSWQVKKHPDPKCENFLGVDMPVLELNGFEPSAPLKIKLHLDRVLGQAEFVDTAL